MSTQSYDAAVIGLGTMGSFACLELARRGLRVIGFDQFNPPHDRGSHSGATRVYRAAYAEHPDYVPLALRAGRLWDDLAAVMGRPALHRCGMLTVDVEDGPVISGILDSARLHALPVEKLTPSQVQERFPAFALDATEVGVFEPGAGWIDVDASLIAADANKQRSVSGSEVCCTRRPSIPTTIIEWR